MISELSASIVWGVIEPIGIAPLSGAAGCALGPYCTRALGSPKWRASPRRARARSATLEATQGQILSQAPTDATRFWWHLWKLTKETIVLPLGCLQGGCIPMSWHWRRVLAPSRHAAISPSSRICLELNKIPAISTLEVTQGQILSQISHRCYLSEVAFVWELTKETIVLPLGCLQGGRTR